MRFAICAALIAGTLLVSIGCGGSSTSPATPRTTSTTSPPSATATVPAGTPTPDAFATCTLPDKPDTVASKDVAQLVACAQGDPTAGKVIAIHHWIARNPNTPIDSLRKLALAAEYPSVRCGVASNPSSPADVITGLYTMFTSCAAANPSTPVNLLCTTAAIEPKPIADDPATLARQNLEARKNGGWQASCSR
jgi:hypothetical protein